MGKISKNELNTSLATKIEEIDLKANISDLETTNSQLAQIELNKADKIKTEFLCTAKAGWTIISQKNYKINNVVYFSINARKTDNSVITGKELHEIATIPTGFFSAVNYSGASYGYGGGSGIDVGVSVFGNNVVNVILSATNSAFVWLSGVVIL